MKKNLFCLITILVLGVSSKAYSHAGNLRAAPTFVHVVRARSARIGDTLQVGGNWSIPLGVVVIT